LLNQHGFKITVASNQSGLARGLFSLDALNQIHQKMQQSVSELGGNIEGIFYCPHGPHDGCHCRKPKAGLLTTIATTYGITLANVPFIGDSLRDIEAAKAAGAMPMLVRTGKGEKTVHQHGSILQNVPIYHDLFTLANEIIRFPLKTN
jgi:D-glycero-D-manno-heptose 1,7-bisphosphate phosphatase